MIATLETERLSLRMWKLSDFEDYAAMCADEQVMRFLGPRRPLSRFEAWNSFASMVGHWHLCEYGMFAVVERTSGKLVGRVGPWQPEGWPDFEIGWILHPSFWGQGYATEAVKACMKLAFTDLNRSHLISIIDPENTRSIDVAKRVGEQLEGPVSLPTQPERSLLQFGLDREQWNRNMDFLTRHS